MTIEEAGEVAVHSGSLDELHHRRVVFEPIPPSYEYFPNLSPGRHSAYDPADVSTAETRAIRDSTHKNRSRMPNDE
jgi:hypothetical protein